MTSISTFLPGRSRGVASLVLRRRTHSPGAALAMTGLRGAAQRASPGWSLLGMTGLALMAGMAWAAGNGGTALQSAFTAVNDLVNGYGKQLLTVIGFGVAAIGYMAANATGVVMKFIGFAVFLSVGMAAAVGLVGALV